MYGEGVVWKDMTRLKIQFPFTTCTGRKCPVSNYVLIIYIISVSFMTVKNIQKRVLTCEEEEETSD